MKKLLVIIFALASSIVASAQTPAQIAKQQIERNVDMPVILAIEDSTLIRTNNLDKIIMVLPMKNNGRIKTDNILFLQSSFVPINELIVAAATKVKLPRNLVTKADTLLVGFSLNFKNLNYHSRLPTRYSKLYKDVLLPTTQSKFEARELAKRGGSTWDIGKRASGGNYLDLGTEISGGGISPPCFRVTIAETK